MLFRQARSRGVSVLSMLRVASLGFLGRDRNRNGPPSLGARAACHFLRQIGVDCDSNAMAKTSGGLTYPTHRKRAQGLDATGEPGHSRDERVPLLRARQHFPQERCMCVRPSWQHGWGDCAHARNPNIAGTASCEEPWSAGCEQSPVTRAQTLLDASTTSNTKDTTARLPRRSSNPSDSPKLLSRSKWVAHGAAGSGYHLDGVIGASEAAKDAKDVDVDVDGDRRISR